MMKLRASLRSMTMKGATTLIIVLSFASVRLPAQTKAKLDTLVFDTFDDNRNGWDISRRESSSLNIRNGVYEVSRSSGPGLIVSIHRYMETTGDFVLQCDFARNTHLDDKGLGLVWGHSRETLHDNYFLIYPDNSFLIQTDQKTRKDVGIRLRPADIITSGTVTLKVVQSGGFLFFYCDGRLIFSAPALPFFGMEAGIITFQNGSFSADNFLLLSDTHISLPARLPVMVKENLVPVNSRYAEIHPIISADARTLYFARKHSPENIGGTSDKQDIWFATSEDGVQWSKGKNLGHGINTARADNLTAVSADNNTMMFYHPTKSGKGGFRLRHRTDDGNISDEIVDVEFENESPFVESCLSAGGNIILFTAKTRGNVQYQPSIDERDVYVCIRSKKGWSKPFNLGPDINSAGDEFSPFLAADERTLYFGTNGRPGYGRVDIFMSKRLDESWTKWSAPVNLGPSVNTPLFDAYYTVPASGNYAYMVSFQEGSGDTDLIRVKLPPELKPGPVLLLRTLAEDHDDGTPLSAHLTITPPNDSPVKMFSPRGVGANTVLKSGRRYVVKTSAKGYLPSVDTVEVGALGNFEERKLIVRLTRMVPGTVIRMDKIHFQQSSSTLLAGSLEKLDRLVAIMKETPSLHIDIEGHTDNVGIIDDLQALSEARARAVKKYLVKKGVASSRINARGYGASRPLVKNDSEDHRRENRRVEFIISR